MILGVDMMTNVLTGTLSYDTEAKTLRLDTDELYPSQDYTLLYVKIASDKAQCITQDANGNDDEGIVNLTLVFDNKQQGLLVRAYEDRRWY